MSFDEWIITDDALGHYTTLDSAIRILKSHSIKFSFVENALDPSERALAHFHFGESSISRENVRKRHSNPGEIDSFMTQLKRYTDDSQIVCFCQNQYIRDQLHAQLEKRCFTNLRMWEQYGQMYLGACLLFSKKKLEEALLNESKVTNFGPINYERNLQPRFDSLKISYESFYSAENKDDYLKNCKERYDQVLLQKDSDYSSEREFRLIVHSSETFFLDIESALQGIAYFYEYDRRQLEKTVKSNMSSLSIPITNESVAKNVSDFEEKTRQEHSTLYSLANTAHLGIIRLSANEFGISIWMPDDWNSLHSE